MTDPVLPPELLARLCEFGRLTHVEPATCGAANLTFLARLDATAVVVKVATADDRRMTVRREGRLLPFLHDAELPVPAVLAVIDDPFPGFVALVLERLPGTNGLAALGGRVYGIWPEEAQTPARIENGRRARNTVLRIGVAEFTGASRR